MVILVAVDAGASLGGVEVEEMLVGVEADTFETTEDTIERSTA